MKQLINDILSGIKPKINFWDIYDEHNINDLESQNLKDLIETIQDNSEFYEDKDCVYQITNKFIKIVCNSRKEFICIMACESYDYINLINWQNV